MSDKPELFSKINKVRLSQNDLVKLVSEYNKSFTDQNKSVNYTTPIIEPTYQIEALTGINHHRSNITPSFGCLIRIWGALRNKHLYLNTGVIYGTLPDWETPEEGSGYTIKIPLSIQYIFGNKKFHPTLSVGFPTGINLGALVEGGLPFLSSVQAGFIYSISNKVQVDFNASINGLIILMTGDQVYTFNNKLPYSIHLGLIFPLNIEKY